MTRPTRDQLASAAVIGGAIVSAIPGVPAAAALAGGVAVALTVGNPLAGRTRAAAQRLLPLSVIGLGGAMDLVAVGRAGYHGVVTTVVTIAACLGLGALLARALRVDRRTGLLVTVGTAICGGSAIAAAAPVVGAEERELSVSLATVFVLNAVALVVFPPVGHALGLTEPSFGLWAALAIHDTSSVVGAGLAYGPRALQVATTVKLARALWIVPLTLGLGAVERARGVDAGRGKGKAPWFIVGFVAAAALATWIPALRPAGHLVAEVARRALVVTLFLIGVGLSREALRRVGPRPLALGLALWLLMGGATLAAVKAGLGV
jgi:uncharacterized integral membrane protein (TIGR00698 family)